MNRKRQPRRSWALRWARQVSCAWTTAALTPLLVAAPAMAQPLPGVELVWLQFGASPQLSLAQGINTGAQLLKFVQTSSHPLGTSLPAGIAVPQCSTPLAGTVGVSLDSSAVGGSAFGVSVKIGNTVPISVGTRPRGVLQFQNAVSLAANTMHVVEVKLTGMEGTQGKQWRRFSLLLECKPAGPPPMLDSAQGGADDARQAGPMVDPAGIGAQPGASRQGSLAQSGSAPPSNLKMPLTCKLNWPASVAEIRPQYVWKSPPAKTTITVIVVQGLPPTYPAQHSASFELPAPWSPTGLVASVPVPKAPTTDSSTGRIANQLSKLQATCSASYTP